MSTPAPKAPDSEAKAADPGVKALEKEYRDSLQKDLASNAELKKLWTLAERYREQQGQELVPMRLNVEAWVRAAPDESAKRQRSNAVTRVESLCQAMARLRTALDPGLSRILHTDAGQMKVAMASQASALGIDPGSLAAATAPASQSLSAAYDALGEKLRELMRNEELPRDIFLQQYFDLEMENAIGQEISRVVDQRASAETRAAAEKFHAAEQQQATGGS